MKLLFDQNLSFRLVALLADIFPESSHVRIEGLSEAADEIIWHFAKENGFAIVTKDDDFYHLALRFGPPPKVIWLNIGNSTTQAACNRLREGMHEILEFGNKPDIALFYMGS